MSSSLQPTQMLQQKDGTEEKEKKMIAIEITQVDMHQEEELKVPDSQAKQEEGQTTTVMKKNEGESQAAAPVISFSVVESLVYESFEANRVELYQYARKEILHNERDVLVGISKAVAAASKKSKNHHSSQLSSKGLPEPPQNTKEEPSTALSPKGEGSQQLQKPNASAGQGNSYESLYSETTLQLSQALFSLHPSQYQLLYPKEFQDILNRVCERITAHVSNMTTAMLDRIFAMHTGLSDANSANRQAIREEMLKEIGAEMKRFQRKYEESRELINTMRKNFLKELQHLRSKDALGGSLGSHRQQPGDALAAAAARKTLGGKKLSKVSQGQLAAFQQQSAAGQASTALDFMFFAPTEGMDEETVAIFNEHFAKMKAQFESKLNALNAINQELAWKVALIDDSKKVSDMTAEELIELVFVKQKDRELLWLQMRAKFSLAELEKIAEEEFAELVNAITEREITAQVQRITEESQFQIRDAKEKMQREMAMLRLQLANRQEEFDKLRLQKVLELDRAREEGYHRGEQRILANMKAREERFKDEREALARQLEEATRLSEARLARVRLEAAFTKWRLVQTIAKIKTGGLQEVTLDQILAGINQGAANLYYAQIQELEAQMGEMKEQMYTLRADSDQWQSKCHSLQDRIKYLSKEHETAQDENSKLRANLNAKDTELRQTLDDLEQVRRVNVSLQDIVTQSENEKASLEVKVSLLRSQNQDLQSQVQNLQQQQKLTLPLANPASNQGSPPTSPKNAAAATQDGYCSDASATSKRAAELPSPGRLGAGGRFNSKIFALKKLESMIEQRQSTMGEVYAAGLHVLHAAVDTADLVEAVHRATQYKGKHCGGAAQKEAGKARREVGVQAQMEADEEGKRRRVSGKARGEGKLSGEDAGSSRQSTGGEEAAREEDRKRRQVRELEEELRAQQVRNLENLVGEERQVSATLRRVVGDLEKALEEEKARCEELLLALQSQQANGSRPQTAASGAQSRLGMVLQRKQNYLNARKGAAEARLEANRRRKEDRERELENYKSEEDDGQNLFNKDLEREINTDELQRAMDYINETDEAKRKKMRSLSQNDAIFNLPQVYQRLWDNVALKSKKARALSRTLDNQRRLEWLKLLLSNNLLHLTDKKKSEELLKKLQVYEAAVIGPQQPKLKTSGFQTIQIGGSNAGIERRAQSQLWVHSGKKGEVPLNMSADAQRLMELYDEEQEALYQRAIKQWQEGELQKRPNQGQYKNLSEQHYEEPQQSIMTPKGGHLNQAYVSMYITEQPVAPQATSSFVYHQAPAPSDEKGIQTDLYLIETLFQDSLVFNPLAPAQGGPPYQLRLSQYLSTKAALPPAAAGLSHSLFPPPPPSRLAGSTTAASLLKASQGHLPPHQQPGGSQLELGIYGGRDSQHLSKARLFNSSKVRAASHQSQAAVLSTRQRRISALAQSQRQSPQGGGRQQIVMEGGGVGGGRPGVRVNLLSEIKEQGDSGTGQRRKNQGLLQKNKNGTQMYQAIPTTNFLSSQPKEGLSLSKPELYKEIALKAPTSTNLQIGTKPLNFGVSGLNPAPSQQLNPLNLLRGTSFRDSDADEMFASSELHHSGLGGIGANFTHSLHPTIHGNSSQQPRIPTVTVNNPNNPQRQLTEENNTNSNRGDGTSYTMLPKEE